MLNGLLGRVLGRRDPGNAPPPPALRPLFAIGDVHGMAGLLDTMLERIATRIAEDGLDDAAVILLGDYIDRGPNSRAVIDLLLAAPARLGVETVFLRGNHEAFALRFLDRPDTPSRWLDFGGAETIESYGIDPHDFEATPEGQADLSAALTEAMGAAHIDFLRDGLVTHFEDWPYFFTHAGIDTRFHAYEQEPHVLTHGMRSFRSTGGWPGSMVVHGHYITDAPDFGPHRLGIDTGAYRSGVLTAAYCHGEGIEIIEVEGQG